MKTIYAADLFCGGGGSSTGLSQACKDAGLGLDLLAVNHWNIAIQTHTANHPSAKHLCESLDNVDPRKVARERLNVLVASPECINHANARGNRPMCDQSRASAWHVLRWAEALYIDSVLVENIPEFQKWGPLNTKGRPIKSKRGDTFNAFLKSLESLGYRVDYKVLNAADYGDPTTRKRLFIQARRNAPIAWPEPTHYPATTRELLGDRKTWRPASDIIDWTVPSQSIFQRKKPLAAATLERIKAGIQKFGGKNGKPFLVILRRNCSAQSLDLPVPAITASGTHMALCEPCDPVIVKFYGSSDAAPITEPLPTVTAKDRFGLVECAGSDIKFRMFRPHELAAAMGFSDDYRFAGNNADQVRLIGNAVPVHLSKALCSELVRPYAERRSAA